MKGGIKAFKVHIVRTIWIIDPDTRENDIKDILIQQGFWKKNLCQSHQSLNESLNSASVVQFGYKNLVRLGKSDAVEYIKNRNWVTVNFLWQEEMKKGRARKERGTERFLAVEGC